MARTLKWGHRRLTKEASRSRRVRGQHGGVAGPAACTQAPLPIPDES